MKYAIQITEQDKIKNNLPDAVGTIKVFNSLPNVWNGEFGFNYAKDAELTMHRIYKIVEPVYDQNTQKLGSLSFVSKVSKKGEDLSYFTYNILPLTATEQELKAKAQIRQFIQNKELDGKTFFDEINVEITAELSGMERASLFEILNEVDNVLYPPMLKIKTGDFASALLMFNSQAPPLNKTVLKYYNEAKNYTIDYYNNQYPK